MEWFTDYRGREIRLTQERQEHSEAEHPEMRGQAHRIRDTLLNPEAVIRSSTDSVELFYRHYDATPVGDKLLCVVVTTLGDPFIITAYFTDTVKRGDILWTGK